MTARRKSERFWRIGRPVKYPNAVKQAVVSYYEEHGMKEAQKRFPGINVKSVINTFPREKKRQSRWSDHDLFVELPRMNGILPFSNQAKFFNRPNANAGSIQAAWNKRYKFKTTNLNGLNSGRVRHLITRDCPMVRVEGSKKYRERTNMKSICLWVDLENHLRPDVPQFIVDAVKTLAEFQRWLHGDNAKEKLVKMIKDRGGKVELTTHREYEERYRK